MHPTLYRQQRRQHITLCRSLGNHLEDPRGDTVGRRPIAEAIAGGGEGKVWSLALFLILAG